MKLSLAGAFLPSPGITAQMLPIHGGRMDYIGHRYGKHRVSPSNPLKSTHVEHHADLGAAPRSLYRGERRIGIIKIMDQWYGPGYRYVKVRGHDSSVYILLFDEITQRRAPSD
jgi:hypothetical protein